jgi:hypothetical protein
MLLVEFLGGVVVFAVASYIFWRIGQENGISPRLRAMPGLPSLAVFVVLGGWSAGIGMVIHSIATMIWA